MRKEVQTAILTASLFVGSCAPVIARREENKGGGETNSKVTQTTPEVPIPVPVFAEVYVKPEVETQSDEVLPFLYFGQKNYPNEKDFGGCTWAQKGCGIMVGAMITRTDPITYYYKNFLPYFESIGKDGASRYSCGSKLEDHRAVLENMGYTFVEISREGSTLDQIKAEIKEYTENGVPVWVDTSIDGGDVWIPHFTMAVGVNDEGTIVFNDPYFGENLPIPDERIDIKNEDGNSKTVWGVYAVEPPETTD
ncbi:MAG TPA: hypothetical protein VJ227_00765 [Patescibacteria group bacterium]|nr:hypothetical protein [Patescibacteria group bacterium]